MTFLALAIASAPAAGCTRQKPTPRTIDLPSSSRPLRSCASRPVRARTAASSSPPTVRRDPRPAPQRPPLGPRLHVVPGRPLTGVAGLRRAGSRSLSAALAELSSESAPVVGSLAGLASGRPSTHGRLLTPTGSPDGRERSTGPRRLRSVATFVPSLRGALLFRWVSELLGPVVIRGGGGLPGRRRPTGIPGAGKPIPAQGTSRPLTRRSGSTRSVLRRSPALRAARALDGSCARPSSSVSTGPGGVRVWSTSSPRHVSAIAVERGRTRPHATWVVGTSGARPRRRSTSSSLTWSNRRYHCPTAKNRSGTRTDTTSSASRSS